MNGLLSKDQWRVQEYQQASLPLYQMFAHQDEMELHQCLLALDGAIGCFGVCDMGVRQGQRQGADDGAIEDIVARHNGGAGLASLSDSRQALASFRRTVAEKANGKPADADRRELEFRVRTFQEAMKHELSSVEFKPEDVVKINRELDATVEVAMSGNALDLIDYIDRRIAELEEVRRRPGRGTEENIPWWKIVAVAAFFGISVWALIRCVWGWFGVRCSAKEGLIYALIAKAAALGYSLC